MSRRRLIWSAGVIVAAMLGFSMYWFTPWRAFTTTTIADELPSVAPSGTPTIAAPANQLLAQGSLTAHAHDTTGTVQIIRLADGRTQLIIRDLHTSDGPDVHIWLSDQPAPTTPPFDIYGSGDHVDLGSLKGNAGNLVYDIPATVDPTKYHSIDLWCVRFSVSFGAAELHPV